MAGVLMPIVGFAAMISVIVVLHELGHYAAARAFGLVGTRFSLGFGPALLKRTDRRGTEWRLSPLLLGGYVSFPGDDPKVALADDATTLARLPRWKRAVVVAAGPAVNLVLAALLFAVIAGVWGYPVGRPVVETVMPGSTAAAVGLMPGDRIESIGGDGIVTAMDVTRSVALRPGAEVAVEWLRHGRRMAATGRLGSTMVSDGDGGSARMGLLGVIMPQSWHRATGPVDALTQGVSDGAFMTWAQIETMRQLATGDRSVRELSGPVRIARASGRTLSMGAMPFLYLMAMVSIAVGVMNLLPIPALDGGHLATYAVEGALRRDLPPAVKSGMLWVGATAIVCLSLGAVGLDLATLLLGRG